MSIAAGKLRHRIEIQEYQYQGQDPTTGQETRSWVTVHECWASIEPLSVRDLIAAQANQSRVTARIVIRYVDGINATMRVVHAKRGESIVYEIEGVMEDQDSGIEYQTLMCAKGVSINGQ